MCFNTSLPSILEIFTRQVLNEDSEMKGSAEVVSAVRAYVSMIDRIQARRKRFMYDALAKLPSTQSFTGHSVNLLSNHLKYPSMFEVGRQVIVVK